MRDGRGAGNVARGAGEAAGEFPIDIAARMIFKCAGIDSADLPFVNTEPDVQIAPLMG